jgi:hypothetical protein
MLRSSKLRTFSLIAYLCIILKGQMIGLPFFIWLPISLFNFWNLDQLFSLLAVIAFVIILLNRKDEETTKRLMLDLVCSLLLASPIIGRLVAVPIEMFNYLEFIIPTTLFFLLYSASVFINLHGQNKFR